MRLLCRRIREERSGQALVELAIALPVMLLILLGGMELARICYAAIEVSNAARAAAQYAILNGGAFRTPYLNTTTNVTFFSSGLDDTGMMKAAQADAYDVNTIMNSPLQWSNGYPYYTCSCSGLGTPICAIGSPPTGCTGSFVEETVFVQMQTTFDPLFYIPLPGWSGHKITLYGYAQAKVIP